MKLRLPSLSRFSLRTLFVMLTLLAIPMGYVGYQWRIVRERREVMVWMNQRTFLEETFSPGGLVVIVDGEQQPWIRQVLGDGITLVYRFPADRAVQARFFTAFPDAQVYRWSVDKPWRGIPVDRSSLK